MWQGRAEVQLLPESLDGLADLRKETLRQDVQKGEGPCNGQDEVCELAQDLHFGEVEASQIGDAGKRLLRDRLHQLHVVNFTNRACPR